MTASSASAEKRSARQILQEFSLPLIAGVIVAMVWANLDQAGYQHFIHAAPFGMHLNLHFLMNDIFMVLFFGLAAKEITEACLPGGSLNPPKKAINPLLGTIGGVVGPAGVYLLWCSLTGDQRIASGWGIPTATDIALAWLVARTVFGASHPAVSFLLLLAVADDGLGLGIIAIFYPDPANPVRPEFLGLVALGMGIAWTLRRKHVQSFWPYVILGGGLSWAGLMLAHLHPALALVPVVPFMPNMGYDEGIFSEYGDGHHHDDTLNRFEHFFKAPVDFGLFGFGLANAGVALSGVGNATVAVLVALVVGKTVGIVTFSGLAHRMGFELPQGMNYRSLFITGLTAGLGLTVALFVAGVAFTDPALAGAAKMGALFSAAVAPVVLLLGKALRVHQDAHREEEHDVVANEPHPVRR